VLTWQGMVPYVAKQCSGCSCEGDFEMKLTLALVDFEKSGLLSIASWTLQNQLKT
jgi:hypothetical protein